MTVLLREELVEAAVTAALVTPAFVWMYLRTRKVGAQDLSPVTDALDVVEEDLYAGDKRIGVLVHDALQTVEAISGQLHENTKELVRMEIHLEQLKGEMEDYLQEARGVHVKIVKRMDAIEGQGAEEGRGR